MNAPACIPIRSRAALIVLCAILGLCAVFAAGVEAAAASADPPPKAPAKQGDFAGRTDVEAFVSAMVRDDHFTRRELDRVFAKVRRQQRVIEAMTRPVLEPPKWYEYAPRFVNPERIQGGVDYWRQHEALLARAEDEYGVPAELVVAIIGVETVYGRNVGSFRVIDALATLAFDYPRRGDFFRRELRQFLLLARELGVSPLVPRGSYAGAMGVPQFMPGSYRSYAVDYDGSGRIDLWRSPADVVGSVANYFARHDWASGRPVMAPARIETAARDEVVSRLDGGTSDRRPLDAWRRDGVRADPDPEVGEREQAGLILLEQADGPSYWLAYDNFFVITRYNRSRLYASAVWELAKAIRERREEEGRRGEPAPAASVSATPAAGR